MDELIKSYTSLRLPHFFKYAKDKEDKQIDAINDSVVNRFDSLIKNTKLNFKATNLGKFDYHMLMCDKDVGDDMAIVDTYKKLLRKKKAIAKEVIEKKNKDYYIYTFIRNELLKINGDIVYVTDVLVKYLFEHHAINKNALFDSFGHAIVENLKNNIDKHTYLCDCCGKRFTRKPNDYSSNACSKECAREIKRKNDRERKRGRKA